MATISVCIITCNEETNIRRCLGSAKKLADEIIVADTGSTDRTKSICEEYGARIFDYKWAEDFSEARNYSVSSASCDWLLLLDADEELEILNPEGLRQYLSDTDVDLIPVHMTHFYGAKPADKKLSYFSDGLRLARNNGAIRFTGKIHESIDASGKIIGSMAETRHLIRILHYGYMDDAAEIKTGRNLTLLLREKDRQPDDPWLAYHLAAEYYRAGRLTEAFREINTAIALFLGNKLKPPSLAYKLKYDLLVTSGHDDLAYSGIEKAIALYPDYADLHFYKGLLQYRREEYDKAKSTFLYCLVLGESNMDYLILSGSGSFLALYYLGLCHEKQGEAEQAAEAFRQAKVLCPSLESVTQRFENPKDNSWGQPLPLYEEP